MLDAMKGSWRIAVAAAIAATALVCFVPSAAASGLTNGGFENGDLSSWSTASIGAGIWTVYSGTGPLPLSGNSVRLPPDGTFAAVTDQSGPGTNVLYRDLVLPATPTQIRFILYYKNEAAVFCTPATLDSGGECNQQYRVDILASGSDPFSLDPGDVLQTLFVTQPGDPLKKLAKMTFTLPGLDDTVMLRFAEVDNQSFFQAAVDKVTYPFTD
jgi:hypothetical protein